MLSPMLYARAAGRSTLLRSGTAIRLQWSQRSILPIGQRCPNALSSIETPHASTAARIPAATYYSRRGYSKREASDFPIKNLFGALSRNSDNDGGDTTTTTSSSNNNAKTRTVGLNAESTLAATSILPSSSLTYSGLSSNEQSLARHETLKLLSALIRNSINHAELHEALKHSMRLQMRPFTSHGDDGKNTESKTRKSSSKTTTTTTSSITGEPQVTEKDFADYLSGKTESRVGSSGHPRAAVSQASQDWWNSTARSREDFLSHKDTPLEYGYKKIRKTNLEKDRARTAANVRRALAGNTFICVAKFGAWISSGSSSMWSEFIHSVVDCGNQSLLLIGLRDSGNVADKRHPYGYGKSVYFWALVSALGTFFLGAGVSFTQSYEYMLNPTLQEVTWQVWGVLGFSFAVDGYVLHKTIKEVRKSMPKEKRDKFWENMWKIRDPATLAILLEDGAACLGVLVAIAGISATHFTGMPVFDGLAGVAISGLLASMGIILVRVNHSFLLGQSVDRETTEGIEKILLSRRSIDNVQRVQSQWTGPETFSFKAEVDFDGTFLAAKLLPRYQEEFLEAKDSLDQELRVLLSWYAEDVMRAVEREVRHIESEIRSNYPGAEYIELEPMSKDADRFAIDDGMEAALRRIEIESLNRFLKSLATNPGSEQQLIRTVLAERLHKKESSSPPEDDAKEKKP